MKIILAYLEEEKEKVSNVLKKSICMNGKKKYIDFLKSKEAEFIKAIYILSKEEKQKDEDLPECSCGTFNAPIFIAEQKTCSNCLIKLM